MQYKKNRVTNDARLGTFQCSSDVVGQQNFHLKLALLPALNLQFMRLTHW